LPPTSDNDPWAEPRLYDFLAKQDQTATLFCKFLLAQINWIKSIVLTLYLSKIDVGSNVVNFPEAALRATQSGHTLCAHTWSHPQMTTQTNEEIVAQLYWCIRSIKEAAGVTTRWYVVIFYLSSLL
jgi:peptidoglycan/xylan/chitin deacetylase (PgdA/CDA1 family)